MPIYEYKCLECGAHVEKMQKLADAPLTVCEVCGGKLEKQWSLSGIQFKGAGWYVNDYSTKLKDPNAATAGKSDAATGGKSDEKNDKSDKSDKSEKSEKTSAAESTAKTETASNKANDAAPSAKTESVAKKD